MGRILLQAGKQSCKLQDMTAADHITPHGDTTTQVPPSAAALLPDTDYNTSAWVAFTASLSEDEQQEHYARCHEEYDGLTTDCPLCNAVAKLRGFTRSERRTPYRFYAGNDWAAPKPLPKWQAAQRRAALSGEATTVDKLARRHAVALLARHRAANDIEELAEHVINSYAPEQTASDPPFRLRVLAVFNDLDDPENYSQAVSWLSAIIGVGLQRRMSRRYTPLAFSKRANMINGATGSTPCGMASLGLLPSVWVFLLSLSLLRYWVIDPQQSEHTHAKRLAFAMPVSMLPTVIVLLTDCLISAGAPQSFRTVAYPNNFGVCRVRGALARPLAF